MKNSLVYQESANHSDGPIQKSLLERFARRFSATIFRFALFILCFFFLGSAAFGQSATTPPAATSNDTSAPQKFEIADVHSSATSPNFVQTFGGVLRDGMYIYRD